MGTKKQSEASLKQWSKLNKKKRKERMKALSDARWSKISAKNRKKHAKKMAEARWGKKKN